MYISYLYDHLLTHLLTDYIMIILQGLYFPYICIMTMMMIVVKKIKELQDQKRREKKRKRV